MLENHLFVAFRDIDPQAPEHVLVIPRGHIVSLNDVDDWENCEGQALLSFIAEAAALMGVERSGYRAVVNVGPDGGQEVQHLHFHILGGEKLGTMR